MNSISTATYAEVFTLPRSFRPKSSIINLPTSHSISFPFRSNSNRLNYSISLRKSHRTYAIDWKSKPKKSSSQSDKPSDATEEDFITRVLKENPSRVERKYLIGNELYTLKEKEELRKRGSDSRVFGILEKLKSVAGKPTKSEERGDESGRRAETVRLKEILKEYKGKLFVPEQVFKKILPEEEEFDREFESLPILAFEDIGKYLRSDMVKFITLRDRGGVADFKDFIVELKEVPGEKSSQNTKWAMKLKDWEARAVLEMYTGPRYEIETDTQATSWVAKKVPDYPHPVASSISTRMMVELGMLNALLAAAVAVAGAYIVSALLTLTILAYLVAENVVWPLVEPVLKVFFGLTSSILGLIFGILETVWENFVDILLEVWDILLEVLDDIYTVGLGGSASLELLIPLMLLFLGMAFVIRLTISRRSKNFRRWDIWQGLEFSQSKPQARVDGSTGVTFNDVAGIEEAVDELQELVRYLKNPELFDKMGIKPPHGVLLEGPPGCGKTLVAKAIAGEAGVPFYQMAGSEFVEVLVGVGSARIRDLFKRAKVNKPSVIFVDEIDALAARRQTNFSKKGDTLYNASTQERETTLNQLLIELDGFDTGKGVIFLGATNRKDLLDPALLRPGRFDRKIRIQPPNAKGRLGILKVHARKVKMSDSVDLSIYAQDLRGWSGARLAKLLQEAALVAVRRGHNSILPSDMDDAVDRLTVGPKSVGIMEAQLDHEGQCRRATTEVGIAMTAHLLRHFENAKVERCERISVSPRSEALSRSIYHRHDDESSMYERRPELLHRLQVFLGARAAEEVIYGRDTSKASLDYLADASWLARKIITIWNLESPLVVHGESPPWRKRGQFIGPRLDFEGGLYSDYGLTHPRINMNLEDEIARRTDDLMHDMYGKTVAMLRRHHAALLKTVKVVVTQMEISGEELDYIIKIYPASTPTSRILEEKEDLGSLPVFKQEQEQEEGSGSGSEMEYSLLTP